MAFDCIAGAASGRERGGYRRGVSSRSRVFSLVTLAAVVASGVVVVGVLATRGHVPGAAKPRSGHAAARASTSAYAPIREARALDRAQRLYAGKRLRAGRPRSSAATTRSRHRSARRSPRWPAGTIDRARSARRPRNRRSALVALHLGLAYYWDRRNADAAGRLAARAARAQPDTPYAVRADDLLHPQYAPGLPRVRALVRAAAPDPRLPRPRQFAAAARRRRQGGAHAKILYGIALQQLGRPRLRRAAVRRRRAARARRPRAGSPQRSAASTRPSRRARSAGSARSRASSRTPRPSASTSACCCSGRRRSKEARKQLQLAQRAGTALAARQAGDAVPRGALGGIGTG